MKYDTDKPRKPLHVNAKTVSFSVAVKNNLEVLKDKRQNSVSYRVTWNIFIDELMRIAESVGYPENMKINK